MEAHLQVRRLMYLLTVRCAPVAGRYYQSSGWSLAIPPSLLLPAPDPCAKPEAPPKAAPRAKPSVVPTTQANANTAAKRDFMIVFLVLLFLPSRRRCNHPTGGGFIGLASIGAVLSSSGRPLDLSFRPSRVSGEGRNPYPSNVMIDSGLAAFAAPRNDATRLAPVIPGVGFYPRAGDMRSCEVERQGVFRPLRSQLRRKLLTSSRNRRQPGSPSRI